ncbi:hypothetical protein IGI04_040619 [Brassica rapa subsp. trilocularis]|uniref:Uncharacterized protein n=1 Tax=Brassica rapa subsp. trilocularis TaxID=1813537 RepID=A0ABQ7KP37_BRACM|nr:hypothetical protein IGI04_040619 [Brassica rapa subsp. trilocularis]
MYFCVFYKGFSDLDLDMQDFQIWKTYGLQNFQATSRKSSRRLPGSLPDDFQEVFQTTSRKSSRRLPGSLLTESSLMSPFLNRFERFGTPIKRLGSGFDIHVFRSGSDFERLMGSILGSLVKYNALEDFQEVFQTTSKKSS